MNDEQQLLLTDSPLLSPKRSCIDQDEEFLLQGCSQNEISTANNTFSLGRDVKINGNKSDLSNFIQNQQQSNFILQQNESQQEQEVNIQHIEMKSIKKKQTQQPKTIIKIDYRNLIYKLELALERIRQKERKKIVLEKQKQKQDKSQYIPILKRIKTPQLRRQYSQEEYQLSHTYRKTSLKRRITTQPDERVYPFQLKQKNMQKYKTDRIINQQSQQQNPPALTKRNGQNIRSKKQFLTSVANWQQMKVLKQKERIQKEKQLAMVGVTFTPEINAKSKLLMKKKGQIIPIYQREVRVKKVEPEHLPPKYMPQKQKK